MEGPVVSKEIRRLLRMRGNTRLAVEDEITDKILENKNIIFLESVNKSGECGSWIEYNALYSFPKVEESPRCMSIFMERLSEFSKTLEEFNGISMGIEEIDTDEAEFYYVLFYIIKDANS